jgi:hypothetical protein
MEDLEEIAIDVDIENNKQLLKKINSEIKESKDHILGLKSNWDGEGSRAFSEAHWKRVVSLLKSIIIYFWGNYQQIIKPPSILPVGDGTIDITWQTPEMNTTINITSNAKQVPCFYGKDRVGNEIQGTMIPEKLFRVILPWLKMYL